MRSLRTVTLLVLAALCVAASPAAAQPPGPPPPNPTDQELQAGRDAVVSNAAEVGRLSTVVADLNRRADVVRSELAVQRETAFQRLLDLQVAQEAADEAVRVAEVAQVAAAAAASAVEVVQVRLDEFAASTYQQILDLGPIGLLTDATSPEDLVARAELTELIAQEQLRALDAVQRASVDRVNAESTARAAEEESRAREKAAEQAKEVADGAVAVAVAAVSEQEALLRELDAERAAVERQLEAARGTAAGLQGQRDRYVDYQRRAAEAAEEERRRAERAEAEEAAQAAAAAAAARAAAVPPAADGSPRRAVDPAVAQLGPQYRCRAGTPRWGPVKRHVGDAGQLLRCQLGIGSVGGVGPRPNKSDHPIGLALDFFVDRPTGDALAECALRYQDRLAVKYVIFRQRINSGSGWRQMEDRGSYVANHMEHVHISFKPSPGGSLDSVRC